MMVSSARRESRLCHDSLGVGLNSTFFILIDSLVFSVDVVQRAFHEMQRSGIFSQDLATRSVFGATSLSRSDDLRSRLVFGRHPVMKVCCERGCSDVCSIEPNCSEEGALGPSSKPRRV